MVDEALLVSRPTSCGMEFDDVSIELYMSAIKLHPD